jgi:hypothetical protein
MLCSKARRPSRYLRFELLENRRVLSAEFAWAFAIGSVADEFLGGLALDDAGNTCIVGRFQGTVDFDPGAGTYELTSTPNPAGGPGNTFIAKYDGSGSFLWARRMATDPSTPAVAVGSDGAIYVVSHVFATKLDAAGNFVWTKQLGETINDVAVESSGHIYVAGTRPGPSSANPSLDAFFSKFDAAGNLLWNKAVGASSSIPAKGKATPTGWATAGKLTTDAAGNVYLTGDMRGTVDFDPGSGTTALAGSAFVTKFSTGGNFVWARTFTEAAPLSSVTVQDIVVGANGNVYTTGTYYNKVDFDPGKQRFVLQSNGVDGYGNVPAAYVSALNSSGNFLWAKSTQSTGGAWYSAGSAAIALDGAGGIYIAGDFSGTPDFNPASASFSLTSAGDNDAFIWQLDTSGNFVWAGQLGGSGADSALAIGVHSPGNIFVAGNFNGTADFDPGPGTYNLSSAGGYDVYVAKLVQTGFLTLATNSAATSSAINLTESTNIVATTKTKPNESGDGPAGDLGRTSAIDTALAELDVTAWRRMVSESALAFVSAL